MTYQGKPCKHGHDGERYSSGACVGCHRAYSAARRLAHREEIRVYDAKWRAEHRDEMRAYAAKYHAENRVERLAYSLAYSAKYRAENPEKCRAACADWAKANPVANAAQSMRRYARKMGAEGGHTVAERQGVLDAARGRCAYCNAEAKLTIDHIIALNNGGSDYLDNLVAACKPCNSSKNDTPVFVWLERRALAVA